MNLAQKTAQIFSLITLLFLAASCDEGCVQVDEFDVDSFVIESNPVDDGIEGSYDPYVGGQSANWHNTRLYSNGAPFLIQISGQWTPWNGAFHDADSTFALQKCTFCAKNSMASNCMCYDGQTSRPANGPGGNPDCLIDRTIDPEQCAFVTGVDCSSADDKNDPAKCTCTNLAGNALDYNVYHFPLNYYDKSENPRIADRHIPCKYDQGMGAYIALFGRNGVTTPLRAYHLFSETEICNVTRNSDGDCLDSEGSDATAYVFRSANNRIFMKDDKNGNNGTDTDGADDEYHGPNELVKVIIEDGFYSDNYGRYNIAILRGVGARGGAQAGLLEFIVSMVEDVTLGEVNDEGVREGGIIEFMYKSIVQDSGFARALQVVLALYIALYGAAHLFGVAEINKKELMQRLMKISLVIFFVSPESWKFYNDIIVSFFKDGMDYLVTLIMDVTDANSDPTALTEIAKMGRETSYSQATRFSYVDLVIKKMLSAATAKKIFGLFFTEYFGWVYICLMYVLIGFFIYVMLLVATIYLVNLLKIIFVLSLGPIFIVFTLFSHTRSMFRNWLGFLGGRSFEVVVLFTVLYNFLAIIDKEFTGLLAYRSCVETTNLGLFSIKILKAYSSHSFMDWIAGVITIAGLVFITKVVIDKAADLSSAMFNINVDGDSAGSGASGAGKMAGSVMGGIAALIGEGAEVLKDSAQSAGKHGFKGMTKALRGSGIAKAWNAAGKALPFRGLRTRAKDAIINGAISNAAAKAGSRTGPERDSFIKAEAMKELQNKLYKKGGRMAAAGVDMETIARGFDKKMVEEPLKDFLKDRANALKNGPAGSVPLGQDMRDQLRKDAKEWAKKNLSGAGAGKVDKLLNSSLKGLMNSESGLSTSDAARRFAGNEAATNRYLDHLKSQEFARHDKKAQKSSWYGKAGTMIGRGYHNLRRDTENNPTLARDNFLRKAKIESEGRSKSGKFNPFNRVNVVDKSLMRAASGVGSLFGRKSNTLAARHAEQRDTAARALAKMREAGITSDRDNRRRDYLMKQLDKNASKETRDALSGIKRFQDLSKKIRGADRLRGKKTAVLDKAKNDLNKQDGRSLLEKTAALSAMHRALGLKGKDPQAALLEKMQAQSKERAEQIEKGLADGSMSVREAKAQRDALKDYDAGLMSGNFDGSLSDAMADNIKAIEDAIANDKKLISESNQKELDYKASAAEMEKARQESEEKVNAQINAERLAKEEEMKKTLEEMKADETSAERKKELSEQLAAQLRGDAGGHVEASKENSEAMGQAFEQLEKVLNDPSSTAEQKDAAVEEAKEQTQSLIATGFEVDFGASVADVMLKDPDVGLKAGDPLLGHGPDDNEVDHAAINAMRIEQSSLQGRVRAAKMQQKIKEYEKSKLDPSDKAAIEKIDKEIEDIQTKLTRQESKLGQVDTQVQQAMAGG